MSEEVKPNEVEVIVLPHSFEDENGDLSWVDRDGSLHHSPVCGKCKREKVNGKCEECGRPTKYTTDNEMIAKVDEYLNQCKDEEYRLVKSEGDKSTSYDNLVKVNLPTLEGFCLMLGINDDTLVEWRKIYKEFSAAVRKIELEQKQRLFNEGLAGKYNPMIAKLGLSANHGMKERSDITTNDKDLTIGQVLDQLETKE